MSALSIIMLVVLSVPVYLHFGALLLSIMDEDGTLLDLAGDFPLGGKATVIALWPFFIVYLLLIGYRK